MQAEKVFSIRTPLQGELIDFVSSSGFDCAYLAGFVRDLVCLLGSYREEDVPLFPEIYVLSGTDAISSLAPGTRRIKIGQKPLEDNAAAAVLKNCANLAINGWSIYAAKIRHDAATPQIEYGLFRAQKHSYAVSVEESMTSPGAVPAILIRNRGHFVVEVKNASNATFTASFTSAPAARPPLLNDIIRFSSAICSALSGDSASQFSQYANRLLLELLQHCHGTLLAATVAPEGGTCPEELRDGVWLTPSLNLAEAYNEAISARDAESLATLQSYESLLEGMIGSDGVVVFSTNGHLLGYRIFLKPTDEEKKNAPDKGGGRRRTYELMKGRLGTSLKAAFFRSQDGATECKVVE